MKPDGSTWKVGIQDIDKATGEIMMISQNFGGSTVTSGIYERGFEKDGVYYHHILDSETGWPIQSELASVTIFSESSMKRDGTFRRILLKQYGSFVCRLSWRMSMRHIGSGSSTLEAKAPSRMWRKPCAG
jgi:hypothetical protein